MSETHKEPQLIGKRFTVVYEIIDPTAWRLANPINYEHNGARAMGVSVGDLMGYSDALEELITDSNQVRDLQLKYQPSIYPPSVRRDP